MTPEELAGLLDAAPLDVPPDLTDSDRTVLAALARTRAALRSWGEEPAGGAGLPDVMPADVAARLDAALAAETPPAAPVAPVAPVATVATVATVTTLPGAAHAHRSGWNRRLLPLAAALVLLAGGTAAVLATRSPHGDSASTSSAPAAGAGPGVPLRIARSGASYSSPEALDAGVVALLAGRLLPAPAAVASSVRAAVAAAPAAAAGVQPGAAGAASPPGTAGGTATSSGTATSGGTALLGGTAASAAERAPSPLPSPTPAGSAAPGAPAAAAPPDHAACLGRLDPGGRVLALDEVSFEGRPSTLVVVTTDQPDRVAVYVVGPDCDALGPSGLRTVRFLRVRVAG